MLNYSFYAIEDFQLILRSGRLQPEDASGLQEVVRLLQQAIKFELPENGVVLGDDWTKGWDIMEPELLHLPFDVVALEYPFTYFRADDVALGNFESRKRIALCFDYFAKKSSLFGMVAKKYCPRIEETGGIILIEVCVQEDRWLVAPWGVVIPRFEPTGTNLTEYRYGKNHEKTSRIGMLPLPILPKGALKSMEILGSAVAIDDAIRNCGEEIAATLSFLAALSCSNVKTQDEKIPPKLNQKRVKSGKLPFYDYKIVTVDTHREGKSSRSTENLGISGRQSPREHLRRGHIRHLSTGKNVWVQAAVIGSGVKGKIDKAYVVK